MRRAGHEGFNFRAAEKYKPVQAREAAFGALRILENPNDWDNHLKRYATRWELLTSGEQLTYKFAILVQQQVAS